MQLLLYAYRTSFESTEKEASSTIALCAALSLTHFKGSFIYVKSRVTEREGEAETCSIHWFTPWMPTIAAPVPAWQGNLSGLTTWVEGPKDLNHYHLPRQLAGSSIRTIGRTYSEILSCEMQVSQAVT